jgi:Acyl-CoA reductase (LuxC)
MPNDQQSSLEGFWLPTYVRRKLITGETEFVSCSFANGRPCEPDVDGAVTVRWPRLEEAQWKELLASLEENRRLAPRGLEFWKRLQVALEETGHRLSDPSNPFRKLALSALPSYTGYSEPMVRLTLGALDMFSLDQFPHAFSLSLNSNAARSWQSMDGLAGRIRFFPLRRTRSGAIRKLPQWRKRPSIVRRPLFRQPVPPEVVLGYAAGNIPGAALLIAFLAQSTTLAGGNPPLVIVKNSRSEPIFSPLVFSALEKVDPDLVSTVAMLVWDYEDAYVQDFLTSQADLVIAAASDETIAQIKAQIESCEARSVRPSTRPIRFHAHGHKVSFTAIGKEMLSICSPPSNRLEIGESSDIAGEHSLMEIVTLLAALDSIFWDQHGCLSSRIHFVEVGGEGFHTPLEYAEKLTGQLRLLAEFLPRGAWPLQQLHDRFDRYKQLEGNGNLRVISQYDDQFLVTLDQRRLRSSAFRNLVNDCQGRVVVVQPVRELMEIPGHYLRMLPGENLQSLSVAFGTQGEGLTKSFLRFVEACGACGVTAIRTIGRGAFPQLAYSWDGYIPLDLVRQRPAGYFTTIEFDQPYEQILNTLQVIPIERSAGKGVLGSVVKIGD